ncbi:MAG: type II toxin-antitoxin system PemK/MazF family toxin [Spirochaetota bacterium]
MKQYDIYLLNVDSAVTSQVKKTRTCAILSPDEMNLALQTIIIAPVTTKTPACPTRVPVVFNGKQNYIVLDQLRTIDKSRLVKKLGKIGEPAAGRVKAIISEMLVE